MTKCYTIACLPLNNTLDLLPSPSYKHITHITKDIKFFDFSFGISLIGPLLPYLPPVGNMWISIFPVSLAQAGEGEAMLKLCLININGIVLDVFQSM